MASSLVTEGAAVRGRFIEGFNDRLAVVTGGASGIGRGLCETLVEAGARVICIDLDGARAASVCDSLGGAAVAFALDVTDREAFRTLAERVGADHGPVHLLCNNAGLLRPGLGIGDEDDLLRLHFDTNVGGIANGCGAFLPGMRAHDEPAHVVNTASIGGWLATAEVGAYCVSKFAVIGLSEALRKLLADDGVGLSILCPGAVNTGLLDDPAARGGAPHGSDGLSGALASGMDPREVARLVLEGVRDDRRYIFTHAEHRAALEARFKAVLDDLSEVHAGA
jgi:NAD(P)-dependent dehydrogenase (short-subunit alcohol dehydrogenase family)